VDRTSVVSTTIASVGYDASTYILEVEFATSGHVYQYLDVPEAVFDEFMRAPSLGSYLNTQIKQAFRYVRV
jgi:hypothetical protein